MLSVNESEDVEVHTVPSNEYSVVETPLPCPSSALLMRPLKVTREDFCQLEPSPTVTLDSVGPVRSIPMKRVCEAERLESS